MLDEDLKSTKYKKSRKSIVIDKIALREPSNDSEEDEIDEPGPSTSSNYRSNDHVNGAEDDEPTETVHPTKFRELLDEIRRMLDHDSVFNRIRSELLDELEDLIREHSTMNSNKKATHRQRFEFFEQLDDLISTFTDLDETHIGVLHYSALQLAKHTPLEVNEMDKEPEFLIVPPQQEDAFTEEVEVVSTRKPRKSKVIDDWNNSTASMAKVESELIENGTNVEVSTSERNLIAPLADHSQEQMNGEVKIVKTNGVHSNYDKSVKADVEDDEERMLETEKEGAWNPDYPQEDAQMDDEKLLSPLHETADADENMSSDSDTTSRASPVKPRREVKKPQKKSTNSKTNGVSKNGNEKTTNRKSSGRVNKAKHNTDSDYKKKRRAAAVVATASVTESIGRPASQRRNTARNVNKIEDETPAEPTYCICEQVSYGNMIGCDNDECLIEWFHFDCVKLKVKPPKGKKWYCPSCREAMSRKGR
ncbi:Inhibitor of growth protein 3-like [Aphelenchoides besseyi]|nr:Inhibitor of growth protein 3-like [Aphelenchoides besseyi]